MSRSLRRNWYGGCNSTIFAVLASLGFGADWRSEPFGQVQSLSFDNLDRPGTWPLVARLIGDVVQVQDVVLSWFQVMV
jgi:hypothetical protein